MTTASSAAIATRMVIPQMRIVYFYADSRLAVLQ